MNLFNLLGASAGWVLAGLGYPGLLVSLGFGMLVESVARLVPESAEAPRPRAGLVLPILSQHPLDLAAAICFVAAATQLAIPLNPVPSGDRNLWLAATALVLGSWCRWAARPTRPGQPPLSVTELLVISLWLVAVLAPAIALQDLRPETLGAARRLADAPVKSGAALLYLVTLPVLLRITGPSGGGLDLPGKQARSSLAALLRWLPFCGLFSSLYRSPVPVAGLELPVFLLVAGLVAGLATAFGRLLSTRSPAFVRSVYWYLGLPLGLLTLAAAAVTPYLPATG